MTTPHTDTGTQADGDAKDDVLLTLQRGLQTLECVAAGEGQATAKTISRKLGFKISTTYHLIRTLRASGHVVRLAGGRLDVGPSAFALSRRLQARSGPAPELSALLVRLHNKTRETAYLSGWYHGTVMLQQFIAGSHALSVQHLEVGYSANLHARASAKAVLAFLPEAQVKLMFAGVELRPLTARTCRSYDEMVNNLAEVRRVGYALDEEEFAEDVCCVSVPFFDPSGAPGGSFTVSSPSSRFALTRTKLIAETREAALMATNLLREGRISHSRAAASPPKATDGSADGSADGNTNGQPRA